MAGCDSGYFCIECGVYVEDVLESELYLRYVLGEVPMEALLTLPDRHIRCNPGLAQYIVHDSFEPLPDDRPESDKRRQDPAQVAAHEDLVTRAWLRQQSLPHLGIDVADYPLPGRKPPTAQEFFGAGGVEQDLEMEPDGRIFR